MLTPTCRANLIALASAYGKARKLSLSQVSKRAYGNASFLDSFKAGKQSISLKKFDEMTRWFGVHWPDGTEWPYLRPVFMVDGKSGGKSS